MKKKVYLSGPMSYCKDEQTWRNNFGYYEDVLKNKGFEVVNPANHIIDGSYEDCLKKAIQAELECDCIFFMPNSILSTGARLEYDVAKACGLEIIVLDKDMSLVDNYSTKSGLKSKLEVNDLIKSQMDNKINVVLEKFKDVCYLQVSAGVRYYEDAEVDGETDNSVLEDEYNMPKMPCVMQVKDRAENYINSDKYRWMPIIDVRKGQIINWKFGTTASIHYKVCDDGEYTLMNEDMEDLYTVNSYVPGLLAINGDGFGDYILMNVSGDGYIEDWKCDDKMLSALIESDFNYKLR